MKLSLLSILLMQFLFIGKSDSAQSLPASFAYILRRTCWRNPGPSPAFTNTRGTIFSQAESLSCDSPDWGEPASGGLGNASPKISPACKAGTKSTSLISRARGSAHSGQKNNLVIGSPACALLQPGLPHYRPNNTVSSGWWPAGS